MENITTKQQLKAQFDYNRKQVLYLTGMSEQHYEDFVLATLADWLDYHYPSTEGNDAPYLYWMKSEALKKWWRFNWQLADDQFILQLLYSTPYYHRVLRYRQLHQCVFDLHESYTIQLAEDFRSMRGSFETEIKQQPPIPLVK